MSSNAQVVRREFVRTALGMLAVAPFAARAFAQDAAGLAERIEFRRLVAANRILAHEEIVDAFGHVSVRDPENARRYVMARSRSPELVEYADLIRFEQDGRSLDPGNRTPYGERMIHGAIYETRSDVNAVVHNHAYPLLPFGITGCALEPMVHAASVIGSEVPIWDDSAMPRCSCRRWRSGRHEACRIVRSSSHARRSFRRLPSTAPGSTSACAPASIRSSPKFQGPFRPNL